jgi:hypothetical protein
MAWPSVVALADGPHAWQSFPEPGARRKSLEGDSLAQIL